MPRPAWICDLGLVAYEPTARLQRSLRAAREAGDIPDTVLVLEHEPVITTGHRTEPHEVALALASNIPVVPTERGGKATYHGPGQVVAYPILDLRRHGQDVKAYVCALEQALIDTLAEFDITAARRAGYPGVWAGDAKIASIGVRVTRWVAYHGIALNVDCDLAPFSSFTPCGIDDVRMTSMKQLLGERAPALPEVRDRLVAQLEAALGLTFGPVPAIRLAHLAEQHPVEDPDLVPVAAATSPQPVTLVTVPSGQEGSAR